MAKKSVASLQTGSKRLTKAIKMQKKDGSDSYSFVEKIIDPKFAKDWLAGKPILSQQITPKTNDPITEKKSVVNDEPLTEKNAAKEQISVVDEKVDDKLSQENDVIEEKPIVEETTSDKKSVEDDKGDQNNTN